MVSGGVTRCGPGNVKQKLATYYGQVVYRQLADWDVCVCIWRHGMILYWFVNVWMNAIHVDFVTAVDINMLL